MRHSTNTRSGSAFFIILLAIAMFAGLSYAVMNGSRVSQANLTSEQSRAAATEIIAYATTLQKTVQTMRLRGVTETQFDFSNSVYKKLNTTNITTANSSCASDACRVFNINGGRANPQIASALTTVNQDGWPTTNWISGHAGFRVLRIEGIGTAAPDLVMLFPFLNAQVCMKINSILGITNPSNSPPVDNEGTNSNYTGNIASFPNPAGYGLGDASSEIIGKSMFCVDNGSSTGNYFYAVLLAR